MRFTFITAMLTIFLLACNRPEGFKSPEDPLHAGREFVRAVLDGDYERAQLYIQDNPEDRELFIRYSRYMKGQSQKERLQLKSASIIINKVETLADSVSIINFSNSYAMKPMDLKIVRENKEWKIDFSYTFSGNLSIQ